MIATMKMPITTIQSLCPACIASEFEAMRVFVGPAGWLGLAPCKGVAVALILTVRVSVAAGLRWMAVAVGVGESCTEGVIAIFESANSRKRIKMFVICSFRVIVPKFTKKGDGVSPQYNTPEIGVFLSNFNLSSIMPAVMGSSYTFHINMGEKMTNPEHIAHYFRRNFASFSFRELR